MRILIRKFFAVVLIFNLSIVEASAAATNRNPLAFLGSAFSSVSGFIFGPSSAEDTASSAGHSVLEPNGIPVPGGTCYGNRFDSTEEVARTNLCIDPATQRELKTRYMDGVLSEYERSVNRFSSTILQGAIVNFIRSNPTFTQEEFNTFRREAAAAIGDLLLEKFSCLDMQNGPFSGNDGSGLSQGEISNFNRMRGAINRRIGDRTTSENDESLLALDPSAQSVISEGAEYMGLARLRSLERRRANDPALREELDSIMRNEDLSPQQIQDQIRSRVYRNFIENAAAEDPLSSNYNPRRAGYFEGMNENAFQFTPQNCPGPNCRYTGEVLDLAGEPIAVRNLSDPQYLAASVYSVNTVRTLASSLSINALSNYDDMIEVFTGETTPESFFGAGTGTGQATGGVAALTNSQALHGTNYDLAERNLEGNSFTQEHILGYYDQSDRLIRQAQDIMYEGVGNLSGSEAYRAFSTGRLDNMPRERTERTPAENAQIQSLLDERANIQELIGRAQQEVTFMRSETDVFNSLNQSMMAIATTDNESRGNLGINGPLDVIRSIGNLDSSACDNNSDMPLCQTMNMFNDLNGMCVNHMSKVFEDLNKDFPQQHSLLACHMAGGSCQDQISEFASSSGQRGFDFRTASDYCYQGDLNGAVNCQVPEDTSNFLNIDDPSSLSFFLNSVLGDERQADDNNLLCSDTIQGPDGQLMNIRERGDNFRNFAIVNLTKGYLENQFNANSRDPDGIDGFSRDVPGFNGRNPQEIFLDFLDDRPAGEQSRYDQNLDMLGEFSDQADLLCRGNDDPNCEKNITGFIDSLVTFNGTGFSQQVVVRAGGTLGRATANRDGLFEGDEYNAALAVQGVDSGAPGTPIRPGGRPRAEITVTDRESVDAITRSVGEAVERRRDNFRRDLASDLGIDPNDMDTSISIPPVVVSAVRRREALGSLNSSNIAESSKLIVPEVASPLAPSRAQFVEAADAFKSNSLTSSSASSGSNSIPMDSAATTSVFTGANPVTPMGGEGQSLFSTVMTNTDSLIEETKGVISSTDRLVNGDVPNAELWETIEELRTTVDRLRENVANQESINKDLIAENERELERLQDERDSADSENLSRIAQLEADLAAQRAALDNSRRAESVRRAASAVTSSVSGRLQDRSASATGSSGFSPAVSTAPVAIPPTRGASVDGNFVRIPTTGGQAIVVPREAVRPNTNLRLDTSVRLQFTSNEGGAVVIARGSQGYTDIVSAIPNYTGEVGTISQGSCTITTSQGGDISIDGGEACLSSLQQGYSEKVISSLAGIDPVELIESGNATVELGALVGQGRWNSLGGAFDAALLEEGDTTPDDTTPDD